MKPRFQRTDRSAFPPAGLLATAGLLTLLSGIAHSRDSQPVARPLEEAPLIDTAPSDPSSVAPDTAWFGGSGQGNGTVVLGGIWDWEASSGETPLFFPDGDPVGNAYRDGWVFEDFTSRSVVSLAGPGHWRTDGTYDFDFDRGSFAHRAKTHPNDGANDGPPALDDPSDGLGNSSWSVWIGTNLHLNPEHCSWQRTAGYADSWSQGIAKLYRFRTAPGPDEYAAPPAGAEIDLRFYHRFAVEDGYDTCWVEVSFDGVQWQQVGSAGDPNGIWNGGTRQAPRPDPDGGPETVSLTTWPGGNGDLHVRLRLSSDSSYSDESYGSDFHFAWQVDDLSLRVDGTPIDLADFETEMGGWEPRRFEGGDAVLTGDPVLPSGRIDDLGNLSCFVGPGACGPQGNVLLFFDRDDCDPGITRSFAVSPAFAVPSGSARLIQLDVASDQGTDAFNTFFVLCSIHSPAGEERCPYAPPPGSPGAGSTFDWSRASVSCDFWSMGAGASCFDDVTFILNLIPAEADSVALYLGVASACRGCEQGTSVPVYDHVRFGVVDPVTTGVGEALGPQHRAELERPAPNPFRGTASIRYVVSERGRVSLRVFDAAGRLVRTMVDREREAGTYEAVWDGADDAGRPVGSGVFFCELRAPGSSTTQKLVVLD